MRFTLSGTGFLDLDSGPPYWLTFTREPDGTVLFRVPMQPVAPVDLS
jgi:hypothetical protein